MSERIDLVICARVAGFDTAPIDASTVGKCVECAAPVWLAPPSYSYAANGVPVVCIECAITYFEREAGSE